MANIGPYAYTNMLNWSLKAGAAPASVSSLFIGLSLSAPVYSSMYEVGAGSGYARQAMSFAAAAALSGSASAVNSTAVSFGSFSNSATISGLFIADSSALAGGSILWYGNLSAARTPLPNDTLVLAASALVITLG